MSHATQAIPRLVDYFGEGPIPIVTAAFRPAEKVEELGLTSSATGMPARSGWIPASFQKRVSRSWLRKLRAEGYTLVQLERDGRRADFRIEELT